MQILNYLFPSVLFASYGRFFTVKKEENALLQKHLLDSNFLLAWKEFYTVNSNFQIWLNFWEKGFIFLLRQLRKIEVTYIIYYVSVVSFTKMKNKFKCRDDFVRKCHKNKKKNFYFGGMQRKDTFEFQD